MAYVLLGTVSRNKGIVAFIQKEDLAMLWNNRLRHVSENSLDNCLSKVF